MGSTKVHQVNHQKVLFNIKKKAKYWLQKIKRKKQVHFIHIGKTGGTAIKEAIKQYLVEADCKYAISLHSHHFKLSDLPNGESAFFFLRNPISRFISGFYSRQRQGQPRYFFPWSPEEKTAFKHFSTPNQLAMALSSSNTEEKEKAIAAMKSIKHVNNSYWKWFDNEEYFKSRLSDIFFIGFQENLIEDFEILKSKLSLPKDTKLPSGEASAHRNPASLDRTLTDEAIENLKQWYKDDFRFILLCQEVICKFNEY